MPLFTQFNKPTVVHIVVIDATQCDLDGTVTYIINERSVVADHQYGAGAAFQKILQPLDRFDIQVVGRLVQ